jgi:hypothetical protein
LKKLPLAVLTIFIVLFLLISETSSAQGSKAAVGYLQKINKPFTRIASHLWDYTSAVGHGKKSRKVDRRRKKLLKSLEKAQRKVAGMPDYKGDEAYRDSVVSYLKLTYNVFNKDFAKIVDMEAIAEESYDAMEAYLKAEEMANQKLHFAGAMLEAQENEFASGHGITLIASKNKIGKKLEIAGEVFKYYNKFYLIFFKSYKQEAYMLEALIKHNDAALQQNADALASCSMEGIRKTDSLKAFKNDPTIKAMCKDLQLFFKTEATKQVPILITYSVKNENYLKIKAAYNLKTDKDHSKAEIAQMTKTTSDFKKLTTDYIKTIEEMNKKRSDLISKWNKAVAKFLDKQIPKYKS